MSFKVIGLGEVLWDLLPSGPQLGGAPANFACHARQLGADVQVLTRIGNDSYGRQILQRFGDMGINTSAVQLDPLLPTSTATVSIDPSGVPRFTIRDHVAWDALALSDDALAAVRNAHALCFGTLAQRTPAAAATIQQLLAVSSVSALKVFDLNLRQAFYSRQILEQSLELADVVKLNQDELAVVCCLFDLHGGEKQALEQLALRFALDVVALTRGGQGSLLYQSGRWSTLPGTPIHVVDTIGAGDAFTAALVLGLLNKLSLGNVHRIAADLAGYVCSRSGATPVLPERIRAAFTSDYTRV